MAVFVFAVAAAFLFVAPGRPLPARCPRTDGPTAPAEPAGAAPAQDLGVATAAWGRIGRRLTGRPVAARTAEATAAGDVTTGTAEAGLAPKGATTSRSSMSLTMWMSGASSVVGRAYPV